MRILYFKYALSVSLIYYSFVERSFHLVFANFLIMFGLLLLMLTDQKHTDILYMGVIFVTCGTYANVSVKIAWFNNNL